MNRTNARENSFIELCRFVMSLAVILHHSYSALRCQSTFLPFSGGWIAVEYFFMLTGAFMMRHIIRHENSLSQVPEKSAVLYTLNKIFRVFPYIAFSTILGLIINLITNKPSSDQLLTWLTALPFNLLLLPVTGVAATLDPPLWYLGTILIVMPVIIIIALKAKRLFRYWIVWFLPILIHGYLQQLNGGLSGGWDITSLYVRAFSGLLFGCSCYLISRKFEVIAKSRSKSSFLTFMEISCLSVALLLINISTDSKVYEAVVLLMWLSLAATLSGKSYTSKVNSKIVKHLGNLSLPLYCFSFLIMVAVQYYLPFARFRDKFIVMFLITVALSELFMLFIHQVLPRFTARFRLIAKTILNEDLTDHDIVT